jgi:hypothetical protein
MNKAFLFTALVMPVALSIATVKAQTKTNRQIVEADVKQLAIPAGYTQNLHWDLPLDSVGRSGSLITWKSANPKYISNKGRLLKLTPLNSAKVNVLLTATVQSSAEKRSKTFKVAVAREEQRYDGYLFAYFEGSGPGEQQEQLRFGVSADAVHWNALNNNQPIVASSEISSTGGIRDPHILRGEDEKTFYLVATDMHTTKDGWDYNPGIIMLKSNDLIHWTHGIVNLEKAYPQKFPNTKWVWAPQTIYDPAVGKYMVYFTVRSKDNLALDFYSAYADQDFTGFEAEPTLLFKAKYGAIDGDIIYKDGLYHFFYKGNTKDAEGKEFANGIQQAVSKTLQGPWIEDFKYVDTYSAKKVSVEGSGIFKLNNREEYILMYDLYRDHRYEFQRSTDLFNFTQTPESFTKNFNPRHGTVMSITRQEAERLNKQWGGVPAALLKEHAPSK